MEIMTAKEARQKQNERMLNAVITDINKKITDDSYTYFFALIKKKYLNNYVVEKLTLAGYEVKPGNDDSCFVSWSNED
jgi:hypothetical protein